MKKASIFLSVSFLSVFTAFAQNQVNGSQLFQLLSLAQTIVNRLSPIMVTIALLAFFWYLIKFIAKGSQSSTERDLSLKGMGYSILALFVMVSIWGIVGNIQTILGITPMSQPTVETLPPSMRNQ